MEIAIFDIEFKPDDLDVVYASFTAGFIFPFKPVMLARGSRAQPILSCLLIRRIV
jgi:hypothetical protein